MTRMAHLDEETQVEINGAFRETLIIACTVDEFSPASLPTTLSFKIKDPIPIYHQACRTPTYHNQMARQEIDCMF